MRSHTKSLIKLIRKEIGEPTKGVEIGVWKGSASIPLLETFQELKLIMVDRYKQCDPNRPDGGMINVTQAEMFEALNYVIDNTFFADDRRVMMVGNSIISASFVKDNSLDFAFIDADHSYESVQKDVPCWWSKLRRKGLYCGHDYNGHGDKIGRFGVKRAVDEWAESVGVEIKVTGSHIWWTIKP